MAQAQIAEADHEKIKGANLTIQPVAHASLVLSYDEKNIYIDPAGGSTPLRTFPLQM
jgi:L-ascorbate metabolism protein UlaG (beta-lactamase superfamily)